TPPAQTAHVTGSAEHVSDSPPVTATMPVEIPSQVSTLAWLAWLSTGSAYRCVPVPWRTSLCCAQIVIAIAAFEQDGLAADA
ncbi:hypothetical protein SCB29_37155, partial [Paraburkholderia sp. SIMBA_055]